MESQSREAADHRSAVLAILRQGRDLTRREISQELGINRSTISTVLTGLLDEGAVVIASTDRDLRQGRGRPAEVLRLDPRAAQYIGIDFSHGRVQVVVVNASREVIAMANLAYPRTSSWVQRCELTVDLLRRLVTRHDVHYTRLHAIGVGMSGPNSASWNASTVEPGSGEYLGVSARVRELFQREFGVRVLVDHHIRHAALAESAWDRPGVSDDLLYLRLSQGVGGAVVSQGAVIRGTHSLAGEMGHVVVDREPGATRCRCGRVGCLETVASIEAVLAGARQRSASVTDVGDLKRLAEADDPAVLESLALAAKAVGRVLGVARIIVDPVEIVLAGEVATMSPRFIEWVDKAVRDESMPFTSDPHVRLARLGEESGALGAVTALMAQHTTSPQMSGGTTLSSHHHTRRGAY